MTHTINLLGYKVKAVKADIGKGTATITLEGHLDEQLLDQRLRLSVLHYEQSRVDVRLEEQQMTLPFKKDAAA